MKDSYTDFHIDFGGTSVWYHVFEGRYLQLAENGTVPQLAMLDESGMNKKLFISLVRT
jgi:hypothetical protein